MSLAGTFFGANEINGLTDSISCFVSEWRRVKGADGGCRMGNLPIVAVGEGVRGGGAPLRTAKRVQWTLFSPERPRTHVRAG